MHLIVLLYKYQMIDDIDDLLDEVESKFCNKDPAKAKTAKAKPVKAKPLTDISQ